MIDWGFVLGCAFGAGAVLVFQRIEEPVKRKVLLWLDRRGL